jgi:hypothetical protein
MIGIEMLAMMCDCAEIELALGIGKSFIGLSGILCSLPIRR